MTVTFGVLVPQGWRMDLVGIDDPIEQYEAMSRGRRGLRKALVEATGQTLDPITS